ncbi:MAG: hypothetical protein FWB91_03285 [Defluviitaleaceae bacterium]|nr:hypothetical protein [Defluviitaleaceae bacterium]
MLEFNDLSNRRGALVPMLAKIHAMFSENATKDTISGIAPPEHIITWRQKMGGRLVDVNRRFLVAQDGDMLAGIFIYRYDNTDIYIEELQIAWAFRNNSQVLEGLLKKLEFDHSTKDATFFAGERIKIEADKEKLASVGLGETHENGWEKIGSLAQAINAMKLRYNRGSL